MSISIVIPLQRCGHTNSSVAGVCSDETDLIIVFLLSLALFAVEDIRLVWTSFLFLKGYDGNCREMC